MNTDIDTNKIMVGIGTALAKDAVKSVFSFIPNKINAAYQAYFQSFEDYIDRTSRYCSFVKTIINRDKPVKLSSIYVKGTYRCGKESIGDDELIQRIRDKERIVVCGFGGIGKTIFCKYLWNSVVSNPHGKIPVFFELRHLNDISQQDLETYIRISLFAEGKVLPPEIFRDMMSSGRFMFILDGFDEIPERNRPEIQAQILRLANQYGECCFVVSSRMDDRFVSWAEFSTFTAVGFGKDQAREVIQKIDFDKDIQKEFLSEIVEKKYEEYKSFFQTPLLTLMMLMTYMQIKYVPESRHIFYRYAFQTLYTLHDASKQGFQRSRFVQMSETQFINVFSLFCLVSYIDQKHIFDKENITSYIEKTKVRVRFDYDADDFLQECVESVNLLYKDGSQYSFIHRSFQEYFSAYAATHFFPDKVLEVVEEIPVRYADGVFPMMYTMSPDVISRMYIIPKYKSLQEKINSILRSREEIDILSAYNFELSIIVDGVRKNSRFGYGMGFNSDIKHFSDAMVAMFKAELPFLKKGEFVGYENVSRLARKVQKFFFTLVDTSSETGRYRIQLKFSERVLTIYSLEKGSLTELKSVPFEVLDFLSESYILNVARSLKTELVFAKRKCDEIVRVNKEVVKSGVGILGL